MRMNKFGLERCRDAVQSQYTTFIYCVWCICITRQKGSTDKSLSVCRDPRWLTDDTYADGNDKQTIVVHGCDVHYLFAYFSILLFCFLEKLQL